MAEKESMMRLQLVCLCERALLRGNTVDLNSIAAQIITDRLPCTLGTGDYKPKTVLVWVDIQSSFSPRALLHDPTGASREFDLPSVPGDTDTAIQNLSMDGIRLEHEGIHKLQFFVGSSVMGELVFNVRTTLRTREPLYA